MKTTEQLITEGAEYFRKTGKHLFTTYNPNGTSYYHVCLMEKEEIQYRVSISFSTDSETVYCNFSRLDNYPVPVSEFSQLYFTPDRKSKAVRQNKFLKEVLDRIKTKLGDNLKPDKYSYKLENEFRIEKSGV